MNFNSLIVTNLEESNYLMFCQKRYCKIRLVNGAKSILKDTVTEESLGILKLKKSSYLLKY